MTDVVVIGVDADTLASELEQRTPWSVRWMREANNMNHVPAGAVILIGRTAYLDLIDIRLTPGLRDVPIVLCAHPLPTLRDQWYFQNVVHVAEHDDIASRCCLAVVELLEGSATAA